MARYFKVCRQDGLFDVNVSTDPDLHEPEMAVFPEQVGEGHDGSQIAEFFAQVLDEPPPPRGSIRWNDAQTLAGYALDIAPDVRTAYGFGGRSSRFARQATADQDPSSECGDSADGENARAEVPVEADASTGVDTQGSDTDLSTDRANMLAEELTKLSELSTKMGTDKLADALKLVDGELISHLDELAEVLQLDSATPANEILQAAIKKLRQFATRSNARRALRTPQLRPT